MLPPRLRFPWQIESICLVLVWPRSVPEGLTRLSSLRPGSRPIMPTLLSSPSRWTSRFLAGWYLSLVFYQATNLGLFARPQSPSATLSHQLGSCASVPCQLVLTPISSSAVVSHSLRGHTLLPTTPRPGTHPFGSSYTPLWWPCLYPYSSSHWVPVLVRSQWEGYSWLLTSTEPQHPPVSPSCSLGCRGQPTLYP